MIFDSLLTEDAFSEAFWKYRFSFRASFVESSHKAIGHSFLKNATHGVSNISASGIRDVVINLKPVHEGTVKVVAFVDVQKYIYYSVFTYKKISE